MDLKEMVSVWTRFVWLRLRTSDGLLKNTVVDLLVQLNVGDALGS
jgi:hypothetical protein